MRLTQARGCRAWSRIDLSVLCFSKEIIEWHSYTSMGLLYSEDQAEIVLLHMLLLYSKFKKDLFGLDGSSEFHCIIAVKIPVLKTVMLFS